MKKINQIICIQITCFAFAALISTSANSQNKNRKNRNTHRQLGETTSLDVYVNQGNLDLLIGKTSSESNSKLYHRRSTDKGKSWSEPIRVDRNEEPVKGARRAMDPQLCVSGDNIIAAWTKPGKGRFGSGPLVTSISHDGGKSWQPGGRPADSNVEDGQGFVDITADQNGRFHIVWLDNRNNKRGLRYAQSTDFGKNWEPNQTIDGETCECCWNTIQQSDDGSLHVLYRDVNPRDMAIASLLPDGTWNRSNRVGEFDWAFTGCPHVGGGLAIKQTNESNELHSVVWTGNQDSQGFYYLKSKNGGSTWQSPKKLGNSKAKQGDIAINSKGFITAVWNEFIETESAVFTSMSSNNGDTWSKARRISLPGHETEYPRIVSIADTFYIFWTEKKDGKSSWEMSSL